MRKLLVLSTCLTLAVSALAQPTPTTIAYLRTLQDANYNPSDSNTVWQITGTVVTHTNLTSASGSEFFVQDATAGIAVYIPGADAPKPPAGAYVTVTGRLNQFNGLLELGWDVAVVTNSLNHPLPAAAPLNFAASSASLESLEGSYVVASNILVQPGDTFPASGSIWLTNQFGETFVLYVNAYTDIGGTPRPIGLTTIFGVVGQYDSSSPRDSGYQLIPSRAADILNPNPPPLVEFTNILSNLIRPGDAPTSSTYTEYALRTGETLTINALAFDKDGSNVTIYPSTTAPGGAWSYSGSSGTTVPASFSYTAGSGHAGNAYQAVLEARTSRGTNRMTWSIYVPTVQEQNIVISEFLANPTSDTNSPYYNPLHRNFPGSTNAYADDEFFEVVNLNSTSFDMIGWSFYDSTSFRHQFYDTFIVPASDTAVLYGGKLNLDPKPPYFPGNSAVFSEAVAGVSVLNDGGDAIRLYNYDGRLVVRVVYGSATSVDGISWTRFPTLTNNFVEHSSVVITNASPGLQPDQRSYTLPPSFAAPPAISQIANQTISQDTSTGPIPFIVSDPVTPAGNLTVSGMSDNSTLIPNGNIVFGGTGGNRTVTVTPTGGQSGIATIQITVGNAALRCTITNFILTVTATNSPVALFCDNFSYSDGSLLTNSSFIWTNHSGTVGQMQVIGEQVQLTFSQGEDVNALIPGQPFAPGSGPLYYSFTVNFSALPSSAGSYFAHFKDSTTGFKGRLWSETRNAAAGKFRLAVSTASTAGTEVQFPQDLELGITYRVVVKYDLVGGNSTLWIDPVTELSSSVSTTDGVAATVTSIALRQASGIGTMLVDDLCVGNNFASVVPVGKIPLRLSKIGSSVIVSWDNPALNLQTAPLLTGTWTTVVGATSPYTNAISGTQKYFRLVLP